MNENEKARPPIGTLVMWIYGRKDYAEFGEIGTVISYADDGQHYTVAIDDEQPFHRQAYGAKSKRTGHAREAVFSTDRVIPLVEVYRSNATRFRAVAEDWDRAAEGVSA